MMLGIMDMTMNVGRRLSMIAQAMPDAVAVVEPLDYDAQGKRRYRQVNFRQLDDDSDRIARGLHAIGALPGTRLALLVRPSIDFISLVFALFKAGTVAILIDPGMGRRNLIGCLAEAEPEGFIAIPMAQAVRWFLRRRFPKARFNVTVGRRWFWDGITLEQLRKRGEGREEKFRSPNCHPVGEGTAPDDPAAIIFTTGSTGPPKGVLYSHRNFDAQVDQIRDFYDIKRGEIDIPCFPLFGLFNCAMGVTAVIPDMDPSRPAQVDPMKIIEAAADWKATQAFGSPAIWDRVSRFCQASGARLPTIRRVLSAGAPIPADVLERTKACIHPEGDIHTPYGATESLPVASNSATEVLGETAAQTRLGAGVCVGRRFRDIHWKVIRIVDGPIQSIKDVEELSHGDIGELIVAGPQVTRAYTTRVQWNALSKIADGEIVWHRIGDSGYLDRQDRFWFCGRVAHRVLTIDGPMYPVRCEAIFNTHPAVRRSALVGVGPKGRQRPIIIVEPLGEHWPKVAEQREALLREIQQLAASNPLTSGITTFLLHRSFPVDIRHNAKIFREKLALWAEKQM
jgi:olefin beta-lactone synthetase